MLTLGGRTPERLPPHRHGSSHRPLPLWASRVGVLLSFIVFCNIAVFYCIFRRKSREIRLFSPPLLLCFLPFIVQTAFFIPLFSRFPQRPFSTFPIFAGFPSYSCKIMKEFSQIVFPYICNNIPLFLPNSSRIFKIKKSIQKLSAAISFSRKFFVIKKIKNS